MDEKPEELTAPDWVDDPPNRLLRWLLGPILGCAAGAIGGCAFGLVQLTLPSLFVDLGSYSTNLLLCAGLGALAGTAIGTVAGIVTNIGVLVVHSFTRSQENARP